MIKANKQILSTIQFDCGDNDLNEFLLKDSFKFKRKTIKNNLKNYDLTKVEEILTKYNFNLNTRAEEIPLEVFVELANNLN